MDKVGILMEDGGRKLVLPVEISDRGYTTRQGRQATSRIALAAKKQADHLRVGGQFCVAVFGTPPNKQAPVEIICLLRRRADGIA